MAFFRLLPPQKKHTHAHKRTSGFLRHPFKKPPNQSSLKTDQPFRVFDGPPELGPRKTRQVFLNFPAQQATRYLWLVALTLFFFFSILACLMKSSRNTHMECVTHVKRPLPCVQPPQGRLGHTYLGMCHSWVSLKIDMVMLQGVG